MSESRTPTQNNALHKYFDWVAEALDRDGHSMQDVLKVTNKGEIRPTPHAVKYVIWHPIMFAMYGHTSTTQLTTAQVDRVYEMMNAFLSREFELSIPFPANE